MTAGLLMASEDAVSVPLLLRFVVSIFRADAEISPRD
jgi:hypothetical protein